MTDWRINAAKVKEKSPLPIKKNVQTSVKKEIKNRHLTKKIADNRKNINPIRLRARTLRITKGFLGIERIIPIISKTIHRHGIAAAIKNGSINAL